MVFWFMFHKKNPMSYISHHDTVRLFERSFRRAGLSLKFSKGYNPQPKLSFAQPLPLGVEGEREYGEFELSDDNNYNQDLDLLTDKINSNLTDGIKVKAIKKINVNSIPKLMSIVDASLYEMDFGCIMKRNELEKAFFEIERSKNLLITTFKKSKKSKKGKKNIPREKDLKPMLYELSIQNNILRALIKTGSKGNVRPDELARAVLMKKYNNDIHDIENDILSIRFVRKELYYTPTKPLWEYI